MNKHIASILSDRHSRTLYESISWLLSFFLIAVGFRLYAIASQPDIAQTFTENDVLIIRGFASDCVSAFIMTLLFVYIIRIPLISGLMATIWCYMSSANYDNIEMTGTNVSAVFLKDALQPTFIFGSALSNGILIHFSIALITFVIMQNALKWLLYRASCRTYFYHFAVVTPLFALMVAAVTITIVYQPQGMRNWLSYHMLEDNIYEFTIAPRIVSVMDEQTIAQYAYPDLSGKALYTNPVTKPNILLIAIEGLSADMLDKGWLPNLEKLAKKSLYYPNFIAQSNRTVNGMYSMLCADYPRFLGYKINPDNYQISKIPDMHTHSYCLPRMLRNNGYQTVYIQPTSLYFDEHDVFAKNIGYEYQYDLLSFTKPYIENGTWGPGDKAFFKRISEEITKQEKQDKPWFITGLSIGTHHPYTLPDGLYSGMGGQEASNRYMDSQIAIFLSKLKESGILKNTLVMITSDESLYFSRYNPDFLLTNHGFLMVLTPDNQQAVIKTPFTQNDIFISVADYIGADTTNIPLGRSVFRQYDKFYPQFWGGYYFQRVEGMLKPNEIIRCIDSKLENCTKYRINDDDLFYNQLIETPIDLNEARTFLSITDTLNQRLGSKPYRQHAN